MADRVAAMSERDALRAATLAALIDALDVYRFSPDGSVEEVHASRDLDDALDDARVVLAQTPAVTPQNERDQEFFEMLLKWFEDRGHELRLERREGMTAEDFRVMLDEHEIALEKPAPISQERETIPVPKSALDWLFGAAPDQDGKWFGETADPKKKYWWRSKFRSMIPPCPYPALPRAATVPE